MIIADGATNNIVHNYTADGQVQVFSMTAGNPPQIVFSWPHATGNAGITYYAPNANIWVNTDQTNDSLAAIIHDPFGFNGTVSRGSFVPTTTQAGTWAEYSLPTISLMQRKLNPMMPQNANQPVAIIGGVDYTTSAAVSMEFLRVAKSSSFTFAETDSGTWFTNSASGATTWTIPGTIANDNAQEWFVKLSSEVAGTVTISAGAGVTLNSAGSSVASVNLAQHFPYELHCLANPTGASPTCYIWKLAN
jgi:hypothetical protein